MRLFTIIGARPQFVKASAVSRAIRKSNQEGNRIINEVILHTGQHFDRNMSEIFFDELEIPAPDYNLEISNLPHGAMTGRMLEGIEIILHRDRPDLVLVYGDTNSTLAGALAASKLHIPVAHVEAGLRSFNMKMPEEVNRILTDRISNLLLCPTSGAVENLIKEGVKDGVHNVGDVMFDVTRYFCEKSKKNIPLELFGAKPQKYVLCTLHRAENTDDIARLSSILAAVREIAKEIQVIFPVHPRTRQLLKKLKKDSWLDGVTILEPLSYLEMLRLEMDAKLIMTDSGGVQKEAFFHRVPCITLRNETEWVETLDYGWNKLVGADKGLILSSFRSETRPQVDEFFPYGYGDAASSIVQKFLSI